MIPASICFSSFASPREGPGKLGRITCSGGEGCPNSCCEDLVISLLPLHCLIPQVGHTASRWHSPLPVRLGSPDKLLPSGFGVSDLPSLH
jgi:hypothetical protein